MADRRWDRGGRGASGEMHAHFIRDLTPVCECNDMAARQHQRSYAYLVNIYYSDDDHTVIEKNFLTENGNIYCICGHFLT